MKYFQLEGTIEEALLTKFMDFFNAYPDDRLTIVLNNGGGKSNLSYIILDMINSNSERITLVSAGAFSASFLIFYFAKCKKRMTQGSIGMFHKEYLKEVAITMDKQIVYSSDECLIKNYKSTDFSFVKKIMNKKEIKLYNKGDDVYFTFKRMVQIFPDAEIIK